MKDLQLFLSSIKACQNLKDLEALKIEILGKNGLLSKQMGSLGSLPVEERKAKGEELNIFKKQLLDAFSEKQDYFKQQEWSKRLVNETIDVTLPPSSRIVSGRFHPIQQTISDVINIFSAWGFSCRYGPDIETPFYNFTALNVPEHHPARTMQDTFYISEEYLLRTHTSPVQIRTLMAEGDCENLRIIAPGRVYRADSDQTHTPMFHQIEGLVVEEGIHMGHMKGCIEEFFKIFFQKDIQFRWRPSFFPFTEPSAEVDIAFKGSSQWLEVLGCGMVHPKVFDHCGLKTSMLHKEPNHTQQAKCVNSKEVSGKHRQGFAFGMGIERLAMLKYNFSDIRQLYQNDQRWLTGFGFHHTTGGL